MAGVGIFEFAVRIEDAEEKRGRPPNFLMAAQKAVDVGNDPPGLLAQGEGGKGALKQSRHQGGAQSFAGNVRDQEGGAPILKLDQIEIIAAYFQAGLIDPGYLNVGLAAQDFGEQRLLNLAGDGDFAFHALPFAVLFEQARIVQNTCSLKRKRIKDLALEARKCGGPGLSK